MVHFPGCALTLLWIQRAVSQFDWEGFPHSEIPGSMLVCSSPRLIAAYHVLRRLLMPRHPPCALSSLTTKGYESNLFIRGFNCQRTATSSPSPVLSGSKKFEPLRICNGGADEDRTRDPLLAKQVLSQLSYSPPSDCGLQSSDCGFQIY